MKKPPILIKYNPDKTINSHKSRIPIEKLSIDYDVPMSLANLMVSREGERQTAENIKMFIDYIKFAIKESRKRK